MISAPSLARDLPIVFSLNVALLPEKRKISSAVIRTKSVTRQVSV